MLPGTLARVFNLPQATGLLVQRVAERLPAAAIGLCGGTLQATIDGKPFTVGGDIVLRVLGIALEDLASYQEIQARLSRLRSGDPVTLRVLREGRLEELTGRIP